MSAAAVTYFTIGARLVDYASEAVNSLSRLVIPMSSESQAKGDLDGLRKIFVLGNRACAFIILPIAAILTILGKSVIEAWVGPKYVAASYPVLLILLFPNTLMLAQSVSGRTLWGLAKHKTLAWVVMAEGIANLILSIILVRRYGIIGDAIGTAIPLICTQVLFIPAHLCRLLGIKVVTYLKRAFVSAHFAVRPYGRGPFADAALVRSASLARVSDTSWDSGLGLRHRTGVGILEPPSLGCGRARRQSGR